VRHTEVRDDAGEDRFDSEHATSDVTPWML
jgi:hypothetical protein